MPRRKLDVKDVKQAGQAWMQDVQLTIDEWLKPFAILKKDWKKLHSITQNNYELGLRHLRLGNIGDAELRFRMVAWLDPKRAEAWYYLGCSQLAGGKPKPAQNAFRKALALKPDYEEAVYMQAIARGGATPPGELPQKMPLSLVASHFDAMAADYAENEENKHYQGHKLLAQAVRAALTPGRIDHMILELGVGTGLCGPQMREVAAQIIGIDMSAAMLAEAMAVRDAGDQKIYDALINREAHEFLQQSPMETYDAVMAANLFRYIGDVEALFGQCARVLKPGGVFGFTADQMINRTDDGFRFDPVNGYFRFSKAYLQRLAAANGLKEISFEEAPIYPQQLAWLGVFRK